MRRGTWAALAALFVCSGAWAQGSRYTGQVIRSTAGLGGASVRVCTEAATGTPCTPLASIYTDKALTVLDADSIITADSQGNYGYWAAPACYKEQISGAGFSTYTQTVCQGPQSIQTNTQTVSFSATPTFNLNSGSFIRMTLTGNVTSSSVSNASTGSIAYFNICQDATGNRTFAWPTSFLTPPTVGTVASSCTSASFIYDGTNWRELDDVQRCPVGTICVDGVKYSANADGIAAAYAALPSTGGIIRLPRGNTNIATTLLFDTANKPLILEGHGDCTGAQTGGSTLTWTGTGGIPIDVRRNPGGNLRRVLLRNFCINNTGTGATAVRVDGADDFTMENVTIYPTTGFSANGILFTGLGATNANLHNVYVRGNTGKGLFAEVVNAHLVVDGDSRFESNAGGDVVLGAAATAATSVKFFGTVFTGAANTHSVDIVNASAVKFSGCYFENDGTGRAIRVSSGATLARMISVYGSRFKGAAQGNPTTYAMEAALASATWDIQGNDFTGYANPGYAILNTTNRFLNISGNTLDFTGAAVTDSLTNGKVSIGVNWIGAIQDSQLAGNLQPQVSGQDLGTTSLRWDANLRDADLSQLVTKYNNIATVSGGMPAEYATVDLTAQTAAVGTTTLYAVPAAGAGQYRLSWNAKVTTAATTGAATSTLGALTIVYTDPDGVVQTITAPASVAAGTIATSSTGNTTTTVLLGMPLLLNCKLSTNITYAMAYASDTANQMAYNLHIKLEAL